MMRLLSLVSLLLLPTTVTAAETLSIDDLWVRAAPPHMKMTAAYGGLRNDGVDPVTVVSVSTSITDRASIHETQLRNDRAMMRPVSALPIAPGQQVTLEPGGLHLMLMELSTPLEIGKTIDICFMLETGDSVCAEAEIRRQAMHGGHHQ
ncbi:MAG: copper chaperone PCu(A)C [Luminiphilus sp.]